RLLDHHLHTAHAAERLLDRHREPIVPAPATPGVTVSRLPDRPAALAYFSAERANLMAAIRHAADTGLDRLAWQLAAVLTTFFDLRGHWHDWVTVQESALRAAV